MRYLAVIVTFLIAALAASGAIIDLSLKCGDLDLKNGKSIKNATITGYNTGNDRVSITSGKTIHSVEKALLPDEIAKKMEERIGLLVTPERLAADRQREAERKTKREDHADKLTAQRETNLLEADREAKRESRQTNIKAVEIAEQKQEQLMKQIETAAREGARRHFTYKEHGDHSPRITLSGEIEMGVPEPVPGWTGRYRVKGKAFMRDYDSRGSFQTRLREFEVLVQDKDKEKPEVVDITLKW